MSFLEWIIVGLVLIVSIQGVRLEKLKKKNKDLEKRVKTLERYQVIEESEHE